MAEFKLTMNHPHFAKGTEIDVDGIGVIPNGESVTVTQEMQDNWGAVNPGLDLKTSLAQNGALQFNGKDKLTDEARSVADIDPQQQAIRDARNVEAQTGGEK